MNEPLSFLNTYCDFSNPNWVWMLTGMSRTKDGTPIHKYMQRLVVANPDELQECYKRIKHEANNPQTTYRMYISLNARDAVKAAFAFQKTLLDIGYGLARGQQDALVKAKRIASEWKTELAQSHSRATKRILLDIDTTDVGQQVAIEAYLKIHKMVIHTVRKTPNGCHIVIDACDTRDLISWCKIENIPFKNEHINRDSLVFVEHWQGGEAEAYAKGL